MKPRQQRARLMRESAVQMPRLIQTGGGVSGWEMGRVGGVDGGGVDGGMGGIGRGEEMDVREIVGRGCGRVAGRVDENVLAMGGKRMAIRPRKMSLEHMVVESSLVSMDFFGFLWMSTSSLVR